MGNQSASFYQRLQSAQSVVPLLEVRRNLDRGSVNLECCTYHVSGVLGRKRRDLPTLGSSLRQSVLAPRARFELATLRLTAEAQNQSKWPLWCRLQETESHFFSFSCTQSCTQTHFCLDLF